MPIWTSPFFPQCDGISLNLADGPALQGISLLNIPSTHGGTNMWGDSKARYEFHQHFTTRGQFHQPFGTKHKCAGSHSLAPVGAIQFHQQHYAELHHYAQLENTLNF